tara:strand:- start:9778 stop:10044 length:267 start_codon:yes stop_codon:yes gene_type:complete
MVGGEAQGVDIKVEMPGREGEFSRGRISALTQDTIERWIRVQDYIDVETQNDLILMAQTYPDTALKGFVDNFNLMIMRSRENRAKAAE